MKSRIVSTYDERGGAAKAALRLHRALKKAGKDSEMWVKYGSSGDSGLHSMYGPMLTVLDRLRIHAEKISRVSELPYWKYRSKAFETFSVPWTTYGAYSAKLVSHCDLINLHWISGFVDQRSFFGSLRELSVPIVWTLHDMNAFTGGCHYTHTCSKYMTACGSCPQLGELRPNDLSGRIWNLRHKLYSGSERNLTIITPSKWLKGEAEKSALMGNFEVFAVPNGVDTDLYRPKSQIELRRKYKLPLDQTIILFVSDSLKNQRKGFSLLKQTIEAQNWGPNVNFIAVGAIPSGEKPVERVQYFGSISDERKMADVYSLADAFVIPSLQDNLPNTILESMSCGTPVLGFNIGGIPELVADGETGLLIKEPTGQGLSEGLSQFLEFSSDQIKALRHGCRALVENGFTLRHQADQYSKVFEHAKEKLNA